MWEAYRQAFRPSGILRACLPRTRGVAAEGVGTQVPARAKLEEG